MKKIDPLIPTHTTREINKTLDITANHSFLTFIFGETGRGKTLTAEHWIANSYNNGTYVYCQAKCTQPRLSSLIAEATIGKASSNSQLNTKNILEFLNAQDDNYILIIDETNYLLDSTIQNAKDSLNYLRDLREITGIGIALIFTKYDLNSLRHGKLGGFLEQFRGRMGYNLQIPERMLKNSDIVPLLSAYVSNPSTSLINKAYEIATAGEGKIRTLIKYLKLAKEYEHKHKEAISSNMLEALRVRYERGGIWPDD